MSLPTDDLLTTFRAVVDIESVSGNEARLANEVEATLASATHLTIIRHGNTIVARTNLGRTERVVIAGHLDTVPVADNLPSSLITDERGPVLVGRGTADMKGGVTVMLSLALELDAPNRDLTWIWYDNEEVDQARNGLKLLADAHPELLAGDLAILMEPTGARIEGGCQGTMRFDITIGGRAAHSARSWLGSNAIHTAGELIERVRAFDAAQIEVDGLTYREGLNVTGIRGGIAGNVIPDSCTLSINYRFAPDKTAAEAKALMEHWFEGHELVIDDLSESARPGLDLPAAAQFAAVVGTEPRPKYGWTDVARFAALDIPALNFGPADPSEAHTRSESCPIADLTTCHAALAAWLR